MSGFDRAYLHTDEVCAVLGMSMSTLRRRLRGGDIPCRQLGGSRHRIYIPLDPIQPQGGSVVSGSTPQLAPTPAAGLPATPRGTQQKAPAPAVGDPTAAVPVRKLPGPAPKWQR